MRACYALWVCKSAISFSLTSCGKSFWCGTSSTPTLYRFVCLCVPACLQVETQASKHSLFTHSCVKQQLRDVSSLRPEARQGLQRKTTSVSMCHYRQVWFQSTINQSLEALPALINYLIILQPASGFSKEFHLKSPFIGLDGKLTILLFGRVNSPRCSNGFYFGSWCWKCNGGKIWGICFSFMFARLFQIPQAPHATVNHLRTLPLSDNRGEFQHVL